MTMSAVIARPPVALFREEQWFGWWNYALVMGLVVLVGFFAFWERPGAPAPVADPRRWGLALPLMLGIGVTVPAVLLIGLLKMTTMVTPTELRVWFGLVPTYRFVVSIESIRSVRVVRYRPLRECGGWGIRRSGKWQRVLSARGSVGVELVLEDGYRLLVGSQRAEELAGHLDRVIRGPD